MAPGPVRKEDIGLSRTIMITAESGTLGGRPDYVRITVGNHLVQAVSGDGAGCLGVAADGYTVEAVHAFFRADPQGTVPVDIKGYDEVVGQAVDSGQELVASGTGGALPEDRQAGGEENTAGQEE